jgi:hypothetical protein
MASLTSISGVFQPASEDFIPNIVAMLNMHADAHRLRQTFLFNLGIHHLPLLPALHTLRLIALPPLTLALPAPGMPPVQPGPAPPVVDDDADDDLSGAKADGDTDAETAGGECVHAWARYNPALRRVQLGRVAGRTWARRFQFAGGRGSGGQGGDVWETDVEDEERRAEAWARAYEE